MKEVSAFCFIMSFALLGIFLFYGKLNQSQYNWRSAKARRHVFSNEDTYYALEEDTAESARNTLYGHSQAPITDDTSMEDQENTSQEDQEDISQEDKADSSQEDKTDNSHEQQTGVSEEDKADKSEEAKADNSHEQQTDVSEEEKADNSQEDKVDNSQEDKADNSQEQQTDVSEEDKTDNSQGDKADNSLENKADNLQEQQKDVSQENNTDGTDASRQFTESRSSGKSKDSTIANTVSKESGDVAKVEEEAGTGQPKCPDVLNVMLNGTWRQNPMTAEQIKERKTFYQDAYRIRGLPINLQRKDLLCGNVAFPKPQDVVRALCDHEGATPCCYQGVCRNRSVEECTCKDCYDRRTLIHPEYSTWLPADPRCQPHKLPVSEMCSLLKGSTIVFVGDSITRHMYVAFLMVVRDDEQHGALIKSAKNNSEIWSKCVGKNMFPYGTRCNSWLQKQAWLCNGTVKAIYRGLYKADEQSGKQSVVQKVFRVFKDLKKAFKGLAVMGFGLHFQLNVSTIAANVLLPSLRILNFTKHEESPRKPHLLWASIHKPSMFKSPVHEKQMFPYVNRFNHEMESFWQPWGVRIFDTVNMTSQGLMTFDGTHYGVTVNKLKATMLLHYIRELKARGKW